MHKNFLTVVGITILFLGIGIQPVIALSVKEKNIEVVNNKSGDNWGLGLIVCIVWGEMRNPGYPGWFPFPTIPLPFTGTIITCKDLDAGKTRIGIAKLGCKLFKFLPLGHDYKLVFSIILGIERYIYNFDGFESIDVNINSIG